MFIFAPELEQTSRELIVNGCLFMIIHWSGIGNETPDELAQGLPKTPPDAL
jgi:hypothetical protein